MKPIPLISLGACGATALTGAGVAVSHYYGGDSIKSYIEKTKKSKNKLFIASAKLTEHLADIKSKYTKNTKNDNKPKDEKGAQITADQLVQWCTDNANTKFSNDKDATYLNVLSWCFVNPKTISEEIDSLGKKLLSDQNDNGEEWKEAWKKYNSRENKEVFKIYETGYEKLNQDEETEGGKELHRWCTAKKGEQKKLYEEGIERIYELFEAFCTKNKQ